MKAVSASVILFVASVTLGSAATLVQFTGGTTAGTFSNAATTVETGVTAGSLTKGASLTFGASGVDFPGAATVPALLVGMTTSTGSVGDAIAATHFFSFTLTPQTGQQVSLTTLSWIGNANSAAAPHNFTLQVDTGSGFTTIDTYKYLNNSSSTTPTVADEPSFDLSAYSNLTATTTFRVVVWNDVAGSTSSSTARLDDLTLSGTVSAIPEPTTVGLLLGGAALAGFRRRRA